MQQTDKIEALNTLDTPVQQKAETIELIQPEVKTSELDKIIVRGGQQLNGEIAISGAKNAALKHMCAALLTDETITFTNVPVYLRDVRFLGQVLSHLGMTVALSSDGKAILRAQNIKTHVAPYDLVRKMRASVLVLGPLLARHGEAEVSLPGGCAIGGRPIDLHLKGLEAMGAEIEIDNGYIKAKAPKGGLHGAEIIFPFVSVGATDQLLMTATLAKGETILRNAAREPEIVDQGNALIKMGAKIEGLGTSEIRIQGVDKLHGMTHDIVADRIETGTYLCGLGLTGGRLRLKNTHIDLMPALVRPLIDAGIDIEQDGSDIVAAHEGDLLRGTDIMTEPHPGFPTDMQAQFMAMMSRCEGASMITETIFENRFMHVPELNRMGANITVQGQSAIVRGVKRLKGAEVMATDLRASVALVLAGLVAEGETTVNRIYHLERGYENIVGKLSAVGADIERR